ncbi:MAG: PHB depolymerase family esterase [Burkholderiaceae bacterium]
MQTPAVRRRSAPAEPGDWALGHAVGAGLSRRYRLYRPPGVASREQLPLLVMLHGCGQDADSFAAATRMNALALRHRFLVLYPEQDRLANPQGCWNWFEARSGRAQAEAASVMLAIDQVLRLYPADPTRIALAGLSAGASLAGLIATRYPARFSAVCMHSGVAPGAAESSASALSAMRGRRVAPALGLPGLPALLIVQGSDDKVVSVANAQTTADLWAASVGAIARPSKTVQRGQRYPVIVTEYVRAGKGAAVAVVAVTRCEVLGLGHAWSGGRKDAEHTDARGPDASRMIYKFVAAGWKPSVARTA